MMGRIFIAPHLTIQSIQGDNNETTSLSFKMDYSAAHNHPDRGIRPDACIPGLRKCQRTHPGRCAAGTKRQMMWIPPLKYLEAVFSNDGGDPRVFLGEIALDEVGWVNTTTLTAQVPWGINAGVYTLKGGQPGWRRSHPGFTL